MAAASSAPIGDFSKIIGGYGVLNSDNLLKVAIISNLGTFLLYGMTCLATYIAFSHVKGAEPFTTKIIPIIGMFLNFGLMIGDVYFALFAPSATDARKYDAKVALIFSASFMVLSFLYHAVRSAMKRSLCCCHRTTRTFPRHLKRQS